METTFTAVYEEVPESEGGGYAAYIEEMPGANTQGETLEEARENIRDAVAMLLDARRELLGEVHTGHKIIREKITIPVL